MILNNLELLDYGYSGMLSDSGSANVIDTLYNRLLDNPLRVLDLLACTGNESDKIGDCVLKLGKDICNDTGDEEICDMVAKADIINDTAKSLLRSAELVVPDVLPLDSSVPVLPSVDNLAVPKVDIVSKLNNVIESFGSFDCSSMSAVQKQDLVDSLNRLESQFISAGKESEFNSLLNRFSCDVLDEFKCGVVDNEITFSVSPVCSRSFIQLWGKPLAIGGVSGLTAGVGFHKILKGPTSMSVLVGIVTGAGVSYYIKHREHQNG